VLAEPLHLLIIMDKRPEAADGLALFQGLLDHFDRSFDPKAKSVFIS